MMCYLESQVTIKIHFENKVEKFHFIYLVSLHDFRVRLRNRSLIRRYQNLLLVSMILVLNGSDWLLRKFQLLWSHDDPKTLTKFETNSSPRRLESGPTVIPKRGLVWKEKKLMNYRRRRSFGLVSYRPL